MQLDGTNFLVQYKKLGAQVTLLQGAITRPVDQVAFAAYGKNVRVRNAKRCTVGL